MKLNFCSNYYYMRLHNRLTNTFIRYTCLITCKTTYYKLAYLPSLLVNHMGGRTINARASLYMPAMESGDYIAITVSIAKCVCTSSSIPGHLRPALSSQPHPAWSIPGHRLYPASPIQPDPSPRHRPSPSSTSQPGPSPRHRPSPSSLVQPAPSNLVRPPSISIQPCPASPVHPRPPSIFIQPCPSSSIHPSQLILVLTSSPKPCIPSS